MPKQQRIGDRFNMDSNQVTSAKEFAGFATDLTDEEVKQAIQIVNLIRVKYAGRSNTAKNLEDLRDEVLTRLSDVGVVATFDPTPCFYGEPPEMEIVGKVQNDPIHKHGFDHERKRHEVLEANKRNEDYRGQKERTNKAKK